MSGALARVYPELAAMYGSAVPDFRGLFLRGFGGESAALGVTQIDTMRPITGSWTSVYTYAPVMTGALTYARISSGMQGGSAAERGSLALNSALLGNHFSGTETRPVNRAVIYLIRAKN